MSSYSLKPVVRPSIHSSVFLDVLSAVGPTVCLAVRRAIRSVVRLTFVRLLFRQNHLCARRALLLQPKAAALR